MFASIPPGVAAISISPTARFGREVQRLRDQQAQRGQDQRLADQSDQQWAAHRGGPAEVGDGEREPESEHDRPDDQRQEPVVHNTPRWLATTR